MQSYFIILLLFFVGQHTRDYLQIQNILSFKLLWIVYLIYCWFFLFAEKNTDLLEFYFDLIKNIEMEGKMVLLTIYKKLISVFFGFPTKCVWKSSSKTFLNNWFIDLFVIPHLISHLIQSSSRILNSCNRFLLELFLYSTAFNYLWLYFIFACLIFFSLPYLNCDILFRIRMGI